MDKVTQKISNFVDASDVGPGAAYVTYNQSKRYLNKPVTENTEVVRGLVNQCLAMRRRIFVICVDVFYHAEWVGQVSVDLAKRHHAEFVDRLLAIAKIENNLIKAVWKTNWSKAKGPCSGWIFIFDGDAVQATWEYGELVDDLWKEVSKDIGGTLVLNEKEHMRKATGMIDREANRPKIETFVDWAVRYLAQTDQPLYIGHERHGM